MGVPKFYRWVSERYPCLSEIVREYQIPEFDNLYLDMNGIIHTCSHPNDEDVHFRISEEKIFADIFRYIEFLFRTIKPRKVFFMAIDGVAPRAKMNQQRGRRFRSAKEAETREKEAKDRGEELPKEARFDSNCITPGTAFMTRLHEQLKYFVTMKISTDELWRDVTVILSGHETPGEGEHKIMDYIRYQRSQKNYDPNTRHCLYGLDADLIMLGVCSHEPHFALLREEVKYIRSKNDTKKSRDVNPEAITFHLLHISLLRDYLDHEFSSLKTKLPFRYDLERVIDDWVLMGFLVGNDFIPHLPNFHINKNSLAELYNSYMDVLPTLDGYMNENGSLNLQRFQKYLTRLSEIDYDRFEEQNADMKYFQSKRSTNVRQLADTSAFFEPDDICTANPFNALETDALEPETLKEGNLIEFTDDPPQSTEESNGSAEDSDEEFLAHKKDYYHKKLLYAKVTQATFKEQAYEYIRAIQWNLHYYYDGCISWGWYYPQHYAPYISDVKNFGDIDFNFELGEPFKPFEQLLAVLPAASKSLLPSAYENLVTSPNSPLINFYPENFETDLNGKQQPWEAVVLIPFIDEKQLLDAATDYNKQLTKAEAERNKHGPHLLFKYVKDSVGRYKSPLPQHFPDVEVNHAKCEEVPKDLYRLPQEKIVKGLCKGYKPEVHFSGFPTLRYIKHTTSLRKERVRVFEMASMGLNMMITIEPNGNVEDNASVFAKDYLGKSVFVNWPHLLEARVFEVSDGSLKYYLGKENNQEKIIEEEITEKECGELVSQIKTLTKYYKERRGIEIGETNIVLHVYPLTGRKYITGFQGKITLEKQWSTIPMLCPLQTVVKDIDAHVSNYHQYKTIREVYPKGSRCFVIGQPHYGAMAEVLDSSLTNGKVKVRLTVSEEPDLTHIKDNLNQIINNEYLPAYIMAQRLCISTHLFSRITGTIYVKSGEREGHQKINIGLGLKFNARNEEVPGYSKKRNDTWLFSSKVHAIMEEYLERFSYLFDKLVTITEKDCFALEDLFTGDNKMDQLNEISKWLKSLPYFAQKRQKCNSDVLDDCVVSEIENAISEQKNHMKRKKTVEHVYKPSQLYKSFHFLGYSLPDPKAEYRLFDRVINVREGISVPVGMKGIIIGKHSDQNREVNTLYDVLFDESFVGGLELRCSPGRGFKLSPAGLINISYGNPQLRNSQAKRQSRNVFVSNMAHGNQPRQPNVPNASYNGHQKHPNRPVQILQPMRNLAINSGNPGPSNVPPVPPAMIPNQVQRQRAPPNLTNLPRPPSEWLGNPVIRILTRPPTEWVNGQPRPLVIQNNNFPPPPFPPQFHHPIPQYPPLQHPPLRHMPQHVPQHFPQHSVQYPQQPRPPFRPAFPQEWYPRHIRTPVDSPQNRGYRPRPPLELLIRQPQRSNNMNHFM